MHSQSDQSSSLHQHYQQQHRQHQHEQRSDITEIVERVCGSCGLQPTSEAEVAEMTVSEVRFLATSPSVRWLPYTPFPRAFSHPLVPEMQVFQYKSPSSLPSEQLLRCDMTFPMTTDVLYNVITSLITSSSLPNAMMVMPEIHQLLMFFPFVKHFFTLNRFTHGAASTYLVYYEGSTPSQMFAPCGPRFGDIRSLLFFVTALPYIDPHTGGHGYIITLRSACCPSSIIQSATASLGLLPQTDAAAVSQAVEELSITEPLIVAPSGFVIVPDGNAPDAACHVTAIQHLFAVSRSYVERSLYCGCECGIVFDAFLTAHEMRTARSNPSQTKATQMQINLSDTINRTFFASHSWPLIFSDDGIEISYDPNSSNTIAINGICSFDSDNVSETLHRFFEFRFDISDVMGKECEATFLETFQQLTPSRSLALVRKRFLSPLLGQLGLSEVDILASSKAHIDGTVSVFCKESPRSASSLPRPRFVCSWHVLRALPQRVVGSASGVLMHRYGFVLQFPAADFSLMTDAACMVLAALILFHQDQATAGQSIAEAAARFRQNPLPRFRSLLQRMGSDSFIMLPLVSSLIETEFKRRHSVSGCATVTPLDYAELIMPSLQQDEANPLKSSGQQLFPRWLMQSKVKHINVVPSQTAGVMLNDVDAERYCRSLIFVTELERMRPLKIGTMTPAAIQQMCIIALEAHSSREKTASSSVPLFDYLSDALIQRIMSFMDNKTLVRFSRTCRRMLTLVSDSCSQRSPMSDGSDSMQPLLVATAEPFASSQSQPSSHLSSPFGHTSSTGDSGAEESSVGSNRDGGSSPEPIQAQSQRPRRSDVIILHAKHVAENWEMGRYNSVVLPNGHTSSVRALAFHHYSGALITGASDRKIKLWSLLPNPGSALVGGCPYANLGTLTGPNAGIVTILLQTPVPDAETLNDSILTVGFRNGVVKTWKYSLDGEDVPVSPKPSLDSSSADSATPWKVLGEKQLAAIAEGFVFGERQTLLWDDSVYALDSDSGAVLASFTAHTKKVTCVDFLPGSSKTTTLSGSLDKTMRIWDTRTTSGMNSGDAILRGHTAGVNCFTFLSDSVVASAANDRTVRLWDLRNTGSTLATLLGHVSPVRCVSCDRNRNTLLSGSDDHSIRLWSAKTFSFIRKYEEHTTPVTCIVSDESFLISASSDGSVRVTDFAADLF